jgi:mRNA-degrading endonuclease HigB of HigAB toxin-antitoxin module
MNDEFMIEQQLFSIIEKPNGFLRTKVINVYGNRYRVNVYVKYHDHLYDIEKTKIGMSFFGYFDNDEFIITFPKNFSVVEA